RLNLRHDALPMTNRTRRPTFTHAATVWTFLLKPQPPARALHLPSAFARRTSNGRAARVACAVAARALFGAIDCDVRGHAVDRLFKRKRQRHLYVRTALWHRARRFFLLFAAAEQIGEDVAETRTAARRAARRRVAPVEACEVEWRTAPSARVAARAVSATRSRVRQVVRILPEAIIDAPLLRIGQDVVRFRDQLEAFFGRLIARIHVRVKLTRQPPIRLLDLLRLRVAPDAQHFVVIFFRHKKSFKFKVTGCKL